MGVRGAQEIRYVLGTLLFRNVPSVRVSSLQGYKAKAGFHARYILLAKRKRHRQILARRRPGTLGLVIFQLYVDVSGI